MVDRFATQTGQSPTASRSPLYTRGPLCVVKSCGISASNSAAAYAWAGCGSISTKAAQGVILRHLGEGVKAFAVQPVQQTGILAAVGRIGQNIPPAVGVVQHAGGKGAQLECLFLLGGNGKHITLTYNIRSVIPKQKICIFSPFRLIFRQPCKCVGF